MITASSKMMLCVQYKNQYTASVWSDTGDECDVCEIKKRYLATITQIF